VVSCIPGSAWAAVVSKRRAAAVPVGSEVDLPLLESAGPARGSVVGLGDWKLEVWSVEAAVAVGLWAVGAAFGGACAREDVPAELDCIDGSKPVEFLVSMTGAGEAGVGGCVVDRSSVPSLRGVALRGVVVSGCVGPASAVT
jgi:hypothetical protein